MARPSTPPAERFWRFVDDSGGILACWPWTGAINPSGYGQFAIGRHRMVWAHRFSLALKLGRDLVPGEQACHTCDNRPCVRPDHLFVGLNRDNVDDKMAKGRHRFGTSRGAANGNAKLTEADVLAIRARRAEGVSSQAVADAFGVSPALVLQIEHRRIWRHVA